MIEYKRAVIEDLDVLVAMRVKFLKEIHHSRPLAAEDILISALQEYFQRAICEKSFIAWLAVENGTVIGTSGICFYQLPPSFKNISGKMVYIMNMYTEPAYRNQGIASCLFEKVLEEAKCAGIKKISLHATEMGRPLYEKYGFTESGDEMVLFYQD